MTDECTRNQSERVSEKTSPAGSILPKWQWVDSDIWTERMLEALDRGVKGGRWYSLMDKVTRPTVLEKAYNEVKANKGAAGVDSQTIEMFERQAARNLFELSHELKARNYRPKAVRRTWIPKPGSQERRPLGIPAVRDRVVQGALRKVIEPIFERDFAEHSYGFRPGRGCKDALRRVDELLHEGYEYVVDADLQGYFDTIPHEPLLERVSEKVADGEVLNLIRGFLKQDVMDGMERWTPERGSPQGAVISPLLSNIYLDPLDHLMAERGFEMVRYADDFVILCKSPEEAGRALEAVRHWTEKSGLKLHPSKTRVVHVNDSGGFCFLGYRFERGRKFPRDKSQLKLRETIRRKTRRTNGRTLRSTIDDVNKTLRGWFQYFKHSHRTTFRDVDGYTRMRLRSILRKRVGLKGRGRGADHQRWQNLFFAEQGLLTLVSAHQSLAG